MDAFYKSALDLTSSTCAPYVAGPTQIFPQVAGVAFTI